MRFHSLRTRIAIVVVLLMLAVQLAGYAVISTVIRSNARSNSETQLVVAENVFRQVLSANGEKLTQAATVVAADFGFREAVATHELPCADALGVRLEIDPNGPGDLVRLYELEAWGQ